MYSEYNGRRSVGFNIFYNNNEDVVEIVEIAENLAAEYEQKYAGLVHFNTFIKETTELEERIQLMTQNGLIGLVMVLILAWIISQFAVGFLGCTWHSYLAVGYVLCSLGFEHNN